MSDDRYEIFKQNFLANVKYFEDTGKYHVLNEHADTTPEEYQAMGGHLEPEVRQFVFHEKEAHRKRHIILTVFCSIPFHCKRTTGQDCPVTCWE